jgi:hypothetical protein
LGRLRWRSRVASSTVSAIDGFRPITGLRRTRFGAAAAALRTGASVVTSSAIVALAVAAITLARSPTTAAAVVLSAAAVSTGRALTLGRAFRGVDERGREHHSRGDKP